MVSIRYDASVTLDLVNIIIKLATGGASFTKANLQADWSRSVERIVFEGLGL